jgi:hypothetical protein
LCSVYFFTAKPRQVEAVAHAIFGLAPGRSAMQNYHLIHNVDSPTLGGFLVFLAAVLLIFARRHPVIVKRDAPRV